MKSLRRREAKPRKAAGTSKIEGLGTAGPDPKLNDKLALFGQFVGDWNVEVDWLGPDGKIERQGKGEVHFGWILDGRAIQDVWISHKGKPLRKVAAGTTIRFCDPLLDAWQCIWISPLLGVVRTFRARKVGPEIVLEGIKEDGRPERWIFSEIKRQSFRWRAVESADDEKTWRLKEQMRMQRMGGKDGK